MRPEEHCLLTVLSPAVFGIPAIRDAARATVAPPPGVRTVPTEISSIKAGLMPDCLMTPLLLEPQCYEKVPVEYQQACPRETSL
jgi:hypothetical protein